MKKSTINTTTLLVLLIIASLLLMIIAPTSAQDSYQLATDTEGICINTFDEVIKSQGTYILSLNLTNNQRYKIKVIGNSKVKIDVNNTSIYLDEEKTIEFEGNQTITLYINNGNKQKAKVSIAIIAMNN